MTESEKLLSEINSAAKVMGFRSGRYLCMCAVGNANLPTRLENGGGVEAATAKRLRSYIARELKARTKRKSRTVIDSK